MRASLTVEETRAPDGAPRPGHIARLTTSLRALLGTIPSNQRIIVLSNREPRIHEIDGNGRILVRQPASGVVTALEPIVRACDGIWVAHGSGSADRMTTDVNGHVAIAESGSSYNLRRVWLTPNEERGYYDGFANEGLWPLCHMAFAAPVFRCSDWVEYQRVNRRFADAVVSEIQSPRTIVLVQDYHFALVPKMLRERRPDVIPVMFWHIPWPNREQFALCPYGNALIEGMLGSRVLGFQTSQHCRNFMDSVESTVEASIHRRRHLVAHDRSTTAIHPYPISVEWPSRWADKSPPVDECRRRVREEFGLAPTSRLVVSVDRLDYTKGFEERFAAIERLLERNSATIPRTSFLQIASPTRVSIQRYRDLANRVRARVNDVNRRFGSHEFRPFTYIEQYTEPRDVFRYYRAADVCHVGSLDDGMNLVAKEFVSARDDEHGVLVLSKFAGASCELTNALIVNPYDIDGVADALHKALIMAPDEQRARMRAMRSWIAGHDVYRWAAAMLADANRLVRAQQPGHGQLDSDAVKCPSMGRIM